MTDFVLNKIPYLPFFNISFGPVGQSDDMAILFKTIASNITLGNPSYIEVRIRKSDFLMYLWGLLLKHHFNSFSKIIFFYKIVYFFFSPYPAIIKLNLIYF